MQHQLMRLLIIGISCQFYWTDLQAQQELENSLDIYLVIGQSNMAGRAEVPEDLTAILEGVYLFTGQENNLWVPAKNPFNLYSSIRKEVYMQKLGPAYSFAKKLREMNGDKEVGLVVNARGGTAIAEWVPGTAYYQEIIQKAIRAQAYGTIKGVIWHQGESDVNKLDLYMPQLQNLIEGIRKDLGHPNLPFVVGQLSEDQPERKAFNQMILELPHQVPFTGVVLTEGTKTFDSTHFDTSSQILLGERYSAKLIELLP